MLGFGVIYCQGRAAVKVVRSRWWAAGRIDALQGGEKLSERNRKLAEIGDSLYSRDLAIEPPVDGPVPGIMLARNPQR